jgi:YHS domain-containing protein
LAKLSSEDRALAENQEVCPVSGQPLGSMGTPYKVTVQGREVLLCCPGCETKIKGDPEKYLAKLPE